MAGERSAQLDGLIRNLGWCLENGGSGAIVAAFEFADKLQRSGRMLFSEYVEFRSRAAELWARAREKEGLDASELPEVLRPERLRTCAIPGCGGGCCSPRPLCPGHWKLARVGTQRKILACAREKDARGWCDASAGACAQVLARLGRTTEVADVFAKFERLWRRRVESRGDAP